MNDFFRIDADPATAWQAKKPAVFDPLAEIAKP
jgi:hypothetical protein